MSQHRSVAWQGLVLYRRSRGARRCRAAPGGAGGGAEGTAPAVVLKGQLRDAASATPAPAFPPLPAPCRATSPACCFLGKHIVKDLLGREHGKLKASRARRSAEIWPTLTFPTIYGVWLLLEGGGGLLLTVKLSTKEATAAQVNGNRFFFHL